MTTINVGLLGYGNAGRVFHAPLIMAEARMSLHSIGSRSFVDKSTPPGVRQASIDTVIADPEIDLIVVATPNDSHASLAQAALKAGKHVVVDKPFALNEGEAQATIDTARQADRLFSVFQNRRWDGGFLTVQKAIGDGQLGALSFGAFHFDRFAPEIKDRWREWDQPGAGILYDLGPHLFDQVMMIFGTPDAVTTSLAHQRPGAIVDDFFHAIFDYGQSRVTAHASSLMPAHGPRIALYGEQASLFQFGFDGQEDALKSGQVPGDPNWGDTPGGAAYLQDHDGTRHDLPFLKGAYEVYYAKIADAILTGAPLPVTPDQALTLTRMLDAAFESAETGRRVSITTV